MQETQGGIKKVRAKVMWSSPRSAGASRSRIIQCDDGFNYNVKFRESDQGWRMPINEVVACQIAGALGVPTPEIALVMLDQNFITANPALRTVYDLPVRPGYQFGSKWIPPVYEIVAPDWVRKASNTDEFNKIVVFDVATNNTDRCENHYQNVLLCGERQGSGIRLLSIDHGSCFGGNWGVRIRNSSGEWCGSVMPELLLQATADKLLLEAMAASKVVTCHLAETVVASVPREWGLSNAEYEALTEYVYNQTAKLISILVNNRGRFPAWGAS